MATLPLVAFPSQVPQASSVWRTDAADRRDARGTRRLRLRTAAAGTTPGRMDSFSTLELAAIEIGKRDQLPLLRPGTRLARLGGMLFGWKPPQRLADPRLEALRLVAIALRQHRRSAQDAIDAALAAGISRRQLDALAADLRPSTAS